MSITTSDEQFRNYLRLLGRMQLDDQLTGKVDLSGVIQASLLEAYNDCHNWEQLDQRQQTAWLRHAFANNLADEVRKFRTQARDVSRERTMHHSIEASASRIDDWLAAEQSSPSQQAMRNERALQLSTALARLGPEQQEAIELHHLKGMPLVDVGTIMKKNKGAVAALIFRGTKRLRELLSIED